MGNKSNNSKESYTTSMGLWTDAKDMFAAAKILSEDQRLNISNPTYYLVGHGTEEVFKAFLLAKGLSLPQLKDIGHDLECSLGYCVTHGIQNLCDINDKDKTYIAMLNVYYKAKHFEYRVTGGKNLPPVKDLILLGEKLLQSIQCICFEHYKNLNSKN